jgi:hypothetical protein
MVDLVQDADQDQNGETKEEGRRRRGGDRDGEAETLRARDGDVETLRAGDEEAETARAGDWRGCELGFRVAAGCAAAARAGDRGSELGFPVGGGWVGSIYGGRGGGP